MPDNSPAPNNTTHITGNQTPAARDTAPVTNTPPPAATSDSQNRSAFLRFLDKYNDYFKHPVLSVLIGWAVAAIGFIVTSIVYPAVTNVPAVSFTAEDYSAVDPAVYNDSLVGLDLDTLSRYKAVVPDKSDKTSKNENTIRYSVICGDAENPGHGDFVLRLENHGKAQAGLRRIDINVLDYQPIGNEEISVEKDSKISKPDDYVVLYGSVDPLIRSSEAQRVIQSDSGQLELSGTPINTSLSPGEHGTYYLQASFLKYGYYEIEFRLAYEHNDKPCYRTSKEPVYILYNSPACLPD